MPVLNCGVLIVRRDQGRDQGSNPGGSDSSIMAENRGNLELRENCASVRCTRIAAEAKWAQPAGSKAHTARRE